MMRHQHEARRDRIMREAFEELQELLARDRIEPRAWLIEDQQLRLRHQRASDQHALTLALREKSPWTIRDRLGFDLPEDFERARAVVVRRVAPQPDHRALAADDRIERGLMGGHQLLNRAADDADAGAQIAPVGLAVGLAEHADASGGERQVSGHACSAARFCRSRWRRGSPNAGRPRRANRCARGSPPRARRAAPRISMTALLISKSAIASPYWISESAALDIPRYRSETVRI